MKKMQRGAAVMAFIQCDFRSEALGMATHFCAILPAEDLFALLGAADPAALPRLFVGCGTADRLWPMNQEMHRRLNRRGVAHEFCTCPGGHTWDVWGKLLQTALDRFLGPDKLSFG